MKIDKSVLGAMNYVVLNTNIYYKYRRLSNESNKNQTKKRISELIQMILNEDR